VCRPRPDRVQPAARCRSTQRRPGPLRPRSPGLARRARTTRSWRGSPTAAATGSWRATAPHSHGAGLGDDHFEVVVDDVTRLAYVAHVPDESARSASGALLDAAVWFAEHGVRIEWAYGRPYRTNDERIDALPAWVAYYNVERTHTALGGITPMEAPANYLHGNHTYGAK